MGDIVDVTTTPSTKEETSFKWRIPNYSTLREVGTNRILCSTEFEAGNGVGSPTRWALDLNGNGHSRRLLGLRFRLIESLGGVKSPHVTCQAKVQVRDACGDEYSVYINMNKKSSWEMLNNHRIVLVDDELVINFTFTLVDDTEKASCSRNMMENARDELCTDLGNLLETRVNSDFEIHVKNSDGNIIKMKVHKAILGARSTVLQKMFGSQMKETESGSMFIEDLSAACVNLMLKWIYTGMLDEDWKKVPDEVVVAADKYDLPCLRSFLDQHLHQACSLENALNLRKVARLHGLGMATKNVNKFLKTNIDQVLD